MSSTDVSEQDTRFLRQSDVLSEEQRKTGITVIGAGAVGSWTALTLAKMGFHNLQVFDHDTLETHNISNQMYPLHMVGRKKAEAIAEIIDDFEEIQISVTSEKYDGQPILPGVVITAVDSMEIRRQLWAHLKNKPDMELLIDPRMGLEMIQVFTVNPTNTDEAERYEKGLQVKAKEASCTARSILYTVNAVAGFVGSLVVRHAKGDKFTAEMTADMVNLEIIHPKEPKEE